MLTTLKNRFYHLLGIPLAFETHQMFGQKLVVRPGAVREKSDYDDAWLFACGQRARFVFDVGSNIGQSSLLIALAKSVKQVFIIEANPDALSQNAENFIHSQLSYKAMFIAAFADEMNDAEMEFWTFGTAAAGSMYQSHSQSIQTKGQSVLIPTVTLDTLSTRYQTIPDLVKIDVEGAEIRVLRGCFRIAHERQTRFIVEMHSNKHISMQENLTQVIEWCNQTLYTPYYLKQHEELRDPQVAAHRGRCHVLLQPDSWDYPEWLRKIPQSASLEVAYQAIESVE